VGVASSGDDKKPASASGVASPANPSPSAVDAGVPHSLTVPSSVGTYRRLTGSVADRITKTMRKSMEQSGDGADNADVYTKARFAIYTKNGDLQHMLIFVGMSGADSPAISEELKSNSSSGEVDSMFVGMGLGDAKDYPAGRLGGTLRCGKGPMSGTTATACAWADSSVAGLLIAPGTGSAPALAKTTLDLRNSAER
jgi:hypothetical protein